MALATPNQLYRLNKLGRLVVAPNPAPMTHVDADLAIKQAEGTLEAWEAWVEQNERSMSGLSDALDALTDGTREAS